MEPSERLVRHPTELVGDLATMKRAVTEEGVHHRAASA